ncbi:hypothetical protein GCM10027040_01650 [Halomonas shantousis]
MPSKDPLILKGPPILKGPLTLKDALNEASHWEARRRHAARSLSAWAGSVVLKKASPDFRTRPLGDNDSGTFSVTRYRDAQMGS